MEAFQCKEYGCTAKFHKAKGYCVHHYLKSRYEPRPPRKATSKSLCEFPGQHSNAMCIALRDGKPCCTSHYAEGCGMVAPELT